MEKKAIKLRTVFMGTPSFASQILKTLIEARYNVIAAYTRPDQKTGRKQELTGSAVKIAAEKKKIPVLQPEKFDEEEILKLKKLKPDLIIVAAYGRILPKKVLDLPGFGCLNVHASLLPELRGPSPIQNALLQGKTHTGSTIMLMDEKIDTGDILSQKKIAIAEDETYPDLERRIIEISSDLLLETIPHWITRKIEPKKQDDSKATLCQLIEKSDGKILWSDEAEEIYNRYRALQPWPGVFTFWEKEKYNHRIKLLKIGLMKKNPATSHHLGEVFEIGDQIGVQSQPGVIILREIQLEGKTPQTIGDFINGHRDFLGSILK